MIALTLILLTTLTDIRAATSARLLAMQHLVATQQSGRTTTQVGVFAGRDNSFATHTTLHATNYWYGLLWESQRWALTLDADDGYYKWRDWCKWNGRSVPCHGAVLVEGAQITRIIQMLSDTIIIVSYDEVCVGGESLRLPTMMTMTTTYHRSLTITWRDYRKWASVSSVRECEDCNDD